MEATFKLLKINPPSERYLRQGHIGWCLTETLNDQTGGILIIEDAAKTNLRISAGYILSYISSTYSPSAFNPVFASAVSNIKNQTKKSVEDILFITSHTKLFLLNIDTSQQLSTN